MRASKADRPVLIVANRKNQTICETVDQPVCPIPRLAVVETIVIDNRQRVEINSARERYVMLREVDGFLGRVEISHLSYIRFDSGVVKAAVAQSWLVKGVHTRRLLPRLFQLNTPKQ